MGANFRGGERARNYKLPLSPLFVDYENLTCTANSCRGRCVWELCRSNCGSEYGLFDHMKFTNPVCIKRALSQLTFCRRSSSRPGEVSVKGISQLKWDGAWKGELRHSRKLNEMLAEHNTRRKRLQKNAAKMKVMPGSSFCETNLLVDDVDLKKSIDTST